VSDQEKRYAAHHWLRNNILSLRQLLERGEAIEESLAELLDRREEELVNRIAVWVETSGFGDVAVGAPAYIARGIRNWAWERPSLCCCGNPNHDAEEIYHSEAFCGIPGDPPDRMLTAAEKALDAQIYGLMHGFRCRTIKERGL
jgi:hypothetical protein